MPTAPLNGRRIRSPPGSARGARPEAHYGTVIDAGRKGEPGADAALAALILDSRQPGIVRATALSLLPTFAANIGTEEIRAYLAGISDADPLVRVAAVEALAPFAPEQRVSVAAAAAERQGPGGAHRRGPRACRRAAGKLSRRSKGLPSTRAGAELIAAEKASAERPEAQLSIGAFEAERGQSAEAEAAYRQALRLDPTSAPVMVNLADLYRAPGRDSEAEPLLRQAIALAPRLCAGPVCPGTAARAQP